MNQESLNWQNQQMTLKPVPTSGRQGDGVSKAGQKQRGGGLARVPNLRVCKHPDWRVAHAGVKDELTSCRGTVQSVWQKPPVKRKGGRSGLPRKGKWPPRGTGTTVLTYPGSAPRKQARLLERSPFR